MQKQKKSRDHRHKTDHKKTGRNPGFLITVIAFFKLKKSFKFSHIEKITISLGLYQMKKTDTFIEDIIDKADKALYLSKNSGRNKTSIWLE